MYIYYYLIYFSQVYVSPIVLQELMRIIEESEILKYEITKLLIRENH